MKRQRSRATKAAQKTRGGRPRSTALGPTGPEPTRRDFLGTLRLAAVAAAAVGGTGWFVISEVRATALEHDLSRIGNGVATVVQVHDPQCPRCVALQRETRDALCELPGDRIQYLVANIRTDEGRAFARLHGVGHVTLVLLDGNGRRRDVLAGPNSADSLQPVFARHMRRSGDG